MHVNRMGQVFCKTDESITGGQIHGDGVGGTHCRDEGRCDMVE